MTRYNPICESCNGRPKMDGCGICEECWYGPSAEQIAWERYQAERAAYSPSSGMYGDVEAAWSWHMGPDR